MDWTLICESIPKENEDVVIITNDGSGYNATFKNNSFIINNSYSIMLDSVMYWKTAKNNFSEELNKPCRSCGRSR